MTEQMARRKIAADFYERYFPESMNQLEFIDFNHPVREVRIEKGTRLWGFKDPRISPFLTTFFCIPGTPREKLGVHGAGNLKTNPKALDKVLNQYEVLVTIPQALESVCADGLDGWSEKGRVHPVSGGGWQYKVPQPARHVRYTTAFPQR